MHFACALIRTNSSCISTCKSTRALDLLEGARPSGRFFFGAASSRVVRPREALRSRPPNEHLGVACPASGGEPLRRRQSSMGWQQAAPESDPGFAIVADVGARNGERSVPDAGLMPTRWVIS